MRLRILGLFAPVPIAAREIKPVLVVERETSAEAAGCRALAAAAIVFGGHRRAVPIVGNENVFDIGQRRSTVPACTRDRERQQIRVIEQKHNRSYFVL
jgi:hypothetical protein